MSLLWVVQGTEHQNVLLSSKNQTNKNGMEATEEMISEHELSLTNFSVAEWMILKQLKSLAMDKIYSSSQLLYEPLHICLKQWFKWAHIKKF